MPDESTPATDEHPSAEADAAPEPDDLDELLSLLRARLVPLSDARGSTIPIEHREVLPDVAAVLVLDLPDRIVPVTPQRASELALALRGDDHGDTTDDEGSELDLLWETAFTQVRETDHPDIDVEEPADGVPIMVLSSESYFAATHALWADRFMDAPPDGMLIAVPHRHVVLVHGVRDAGVQMALPNMVLLARHHFGSSETPVSPWAYWLHDGRFHKIEATISDNAQELAIGIPEGLQEAIARLH